MIPFERIFAEIERHAQRGKLAGNEAAMNEALIAIRTLTEVATTSGTATSISQTKNESSSQVMQPPSISPTISSKRLDEEDANGESLFDF